MMDPQPLPLRVMLATANPRKVAEILQIWKDYPLQAEPFSALGDWPDAPETGTTYLENALQKAKYYYDIAKRPCVADDSGIEVAALDWGPGVYTKRFTPPGMAQAQRLQYMLRHLRDCSTPEQRRARFRCAAVAYGFTDEPLTAEGVLEGYIAFEPVGEGGFGYDPIFCLNGQSQTLAEVVGDYKNSVSHRGQAMRSLAEKLLATVPHL
ncbi:RdgB/HAM1 family non-canonical purine NTP pyrophosphatase [bacterium]|nr:RdgB/HAM1 family non-canonical purine NTP pyrophosphatase [bacterium]